MVDKQTYIPRAQALSSTLRHSKMSFQESKGSVYVAVQHWQHSIVHAIANMCPLSDLDE